MRRRYVIEYQVLNFIYAKHEKSEIAQDSRGYPIRI